MAVGGFGLHAGMMLRCCGHPAGGPDGFDPDGHWAALRASLESGEAARQIAAPLTLCAIILTRSSGRGASSVEICLTDALCPEVVATGTQGRRGIFVRAETNGDWPAPRKPLRAHEAVRGGQPLRSAGLREADAIARTIPADSVRNAESVEPTSRSSMPVRRHHYLPH
jgi:hypothetical protein